MQWELIKLRKEIKEIKASQNLKLKSKLEGDQGRINSNKYFIRNIEEQQENYNKNKNTI